MTDKKHAVEWFARRAKDTPMLGARAMFEIAADALDKQIPKKPIEYSYPWAVCPICGGSVSLENVQEYIENKETTYCEHCGQALDWSDTE